MKSRARINDGARILGAIVLLAAAGPRADPIIKERLEALREEFVPESADKIVE